MKKFFIPLLFLLTLSPLITSAGIRSAAEQPFAVSSDRKKNEQDLKNLFKEVPDINDKQALQEYLQKRLKIVKSADINATEISSPNSVSVVNLEELQQSQQKTLSAYDKIYQESLNRAGDSNNPLNADTKLDGEFYELVNDPNKDNSYIPDFPYVTIKLSDNREIMAPAEEHIAYLLSTIKFEMTGLVNITEEFTLVSNNQAFPQGFFRILPKYSYARNGSHRRFDITLKSVTINGEEYPYKITEIGDYLYIQPKRPLYLPTGIYTYKFKYLVDRSIWYYDNFDEFYWDITARTLINVVGSANALVMLPNGKEFLAQNAIVSTRQGTFPERVTINSLDKNVLAFADTEALAVGDDIHLFITLEKGTFLAPDFLQKYLWFIQDNGAVFFSLLALLAIWLAYRISLKQIRRNKDKTKAKLKKSPAIFRLINTNKFDLRSLLSEVLDLISKNIISLEKDGDTALLIKKTDNLKKLPKQTQKLINTLFPGAETTLSANNQSLLKIERTYKLLRRQTMRKFSTYKIKLNSLYILSSIAMIFCGIIAASLVAVNPLHTFLVITVCALLMVPFVYLFTIRFKRKIITILIRLLSAFCLFGIASWMSIYTSILYSFIILLSIILIFFYSKAFSKRSGLLRNKIKETEEYKSYLQKNPELAINAKDFSTRLPYIYAFELENKYADISTLALLEQFAKLVSTHPIKE